MIKGWTMQQKKMASFVGLSLKDASGQTYIIILSETDLMLGKDFF